jgi:hypothetical protein
MAQGVPSKVHGITPLYLSHNNMSLQTAENVTYGHICANFDQKRRPTSNMPHHWWQQNQLPGDCGTPTADMLTTNIFVNSMISTKGAQFVTINIKDFMT